MWRAAVTPRAALLAAGALGAAVLVWMLAGAPAPWGPPDEPAASARAAAGSALYRTHCASCHGVRGEGEPNWKSQRADGTYPAPPHDGSGHTWHHADGLLFRMVREGGQVGAPPGFKSAMPGWRGTLSDAEIISVLDYIKTWWGPAERAAQAKLNAQDPYPR